MFRVFKVKIVEITNFRILISILIRTTRTRMQVLMHNRKDIYSFVHVIHFS